MRNYLLGDFLIRLKNSAMAGNKSFSAYSTKLILSVAECLKKEGYLDEIKKDKNKAEFVLTFKNKAPVLKDLKLVSKPGLRIYTDIRELVKRKKPSILILSTPKGIISSKKAVKEVIGGEVIVEIL